MIKSTRTDKHAACRPEISYPCQWEYTVIGTDLQLLTEVIITACAPAEPVISPSNVSSKGRYLSVKASLEVTDETMRLTIFEAISAHPDVKLVI